MWPTMTFIVPGMLFLLLYPLASFAGEAEQEMEAEAQKLLPQYFTKCGEDYFSKYPAFTLLSFGTKEQPKTYVIEQYKDLTVQAVLQPLHRTGVAVVEGQDRQRRQDQEDQREARASETPGTGHRSWDGLGLGVRGEEDALQRLELLERLP